MGCLNAGAPQQEQVYPPTHPRPPNAWATSQRFYTAHFVLYHNLWAVQSKQAIQWISVRALGAGLGAAFVPVLRVGTWGCRRRPAGWPEQPPRVQDVASVVNQKTSSALPDCVGGSRDPAIIGSM